VFLSLQDNVVTSHQAAVTFYALLCLESEKKVSAEQTECWEPIFINMF
jgi:chromatin segregation and condensation protein Rec8/ScpA/Scc1 (kleisin family)